MPIIQPDTSAAQDMAPIQPGTYPGTIIAVDFQTSKKGNPMIVPKFEVMVEGKKRTRQAYLVVTGEGAYGFDQLLRSAGFEEIANKFKDPTAEKPAFDTDELIGRTVNLVIESTIYENQQRDQIKSYLKA